MTMTLQHIQEWQMFYPTLTGLLFVAMSLNINTRNEQDNARLMRIARDTLGHFLVVLMTSLMFLVPRLPIPALVFSLCCIGVPRTIGAGWRFVAVYHEHKTSDNSYPLLRTTGLSILGGIGLTVVANAEPVAVNGDGQDTHSNCAGKQRDVYHLPPDAQPRQLQRRLDAADDHYMRLRRQIIQQELHGRVNGR
jgi:hypothetical protein